MAVGKNKIEIINVLKVVATFLVLYIHGANIYGYSGYNMPVYFRPLAAIANSAVPVFMTVSGYLLFRKKIEWKDNFIKKIWRLAVPFIIWSSIWVLFELAGHFLIPDKFEDVLSWTPLQLLNGLLGIPFYSGPLYSPLWYVRELFILSLLAPLFQRSIRKWQVFYALLAVAIWFTPFNHCLRESITFFIIGGIIGSSSVIEEKLKLLDLRIGYIALGVGSLLSLFSIEILWKISILTMVFAIFFFCKCVEKKQRIKSACEKIIAFSFIIYVTHGKLLSIVQILYSAKLDSLFFANIGYLLIPAFIFVVCLMFAVLFKKAFPGIYKICNGEK